MKYRKYYYLIGGAIPLLGGIFFVTLYVLKQTVGLPIEMAGNPLHALMVPGLLIIFGLYWIYSGIRLGK